MYYLLLTHGRQTKGHVEGIDHVGSSDCRYQPYERSKDIRRATPRRAVHYAGEILQRLCHPIGVRGVIRSGQLRSS